MNQFIYSIKGRDKHISLLIMFILIFFIGDRLLAQVGNFAYELSTMPDAELYSGRGEADVIILGNSRAYHHLNVAEWEKDINLNVRMYAIQAASMEFMKAQLLDYVDIYGAPKAVILELTCLTWDNDQVLNMRGLVFRSLRIKELLKKYYPKHFYIGEWFHLFRFNSTEYLNILHKIFVNYKQPLFETGITRSEIDKISAEEYKAYFINRDNNLDSLNKIIRFANKNNIILHIMITPFLPEFINNQKEYLSWKEEVLQNINQKNIFYDYSSSIYGAEKFRDYTHLNSIGVNAFHSLLRNDKYFKKLKLDIESVSQ